MSETRKTILVDGNVVDWRQLIVLARRLGYEGDDGMFTTSEAARVLRENGHTVEEARHAD